MMEITKESWEAMVAGQVRDAHHIAELEWRLLKLAKRVEKVSYMTEFLEGSSLYSIEDAEDDWEDEELYRAAIQERRE